MAVRDTPVHITIDSRESRSGVPDGFARYDDVTTDVRELDSGDYVVEEKLGIERKAAQDFVGSLMDGRLFEQLAKMRNQYEQAIVLIEGDVYATQYGDVGDEAITGALTWLAGMSGCGVVTVPSQRYSAMAIRRLAIQQVWGLGYEIKLRTNKPKWEPDVGLYLVEGLPSVGPSTARILMSHFKSAEAVFKATEEELRSIKGVGPKTAEKIRTALTRHFEG